MALYVDPSARVPSRPVPSAYPAMGLQGPCSGSTRASLGVSLGGMPVVHMGVHPDYGPDTDPMHA